MQRGRRARPGGSSRRRTLIINDVLTLPGGVVLLGTEGAGVVRSDGRRSDLVRVERTASPSGSSRASSSTGVGRRVLAGIWGDRQHGGVFAAPGPARALVPPGHGPRGPRGAVAGPARPPGPGRHRRRRVRLRSGDREPGRACPTVVDGVDVHPRVKDVLALPPRNACSPRPRRACCAAATAAAPGRGPRSASPSEVSALAVSPNDIDVVVAATAARRSSGAGTAARPGPR